MSLGSVVEIRVTRNEDQEQKKREEFMHLQDEILQMYGVHSPSRTWHTLTPAPVLYLRNVTQTTLTIEWEPLQIAHADLLSVDVLRNGERIAKVPQPLTTTSTKLSGLSIDTNYSIQLVMYTTAGTYVSNEVCTKTRTLDDMTGVHVCLGSIPDTRLAEATKALVESMNAHWSSNIELETTHLVCTTQPAANDEKQQKIHEKAQLLSLPIVRPHWLFACHDAKRYVNKVLPQHGPYSTILFGCNAAEFCPGTGAIRRCARRQVRPGARGCGRAAS